MGRWLLELGALLPVAGEADIGFARLRQHRIAVLVHPVAIGAGHAASLVRVYWRHYAEELPDYRSTDCHEGGSLDLWYADSIWP